MELQDGAAAVPKPHTRSGSSSSPPPDLCNLDHASHFTSLLDRLRHFTHTLPGSADTPSHLDTLLSFLQPDPSSPSNPLPARQLAYIEALAALSPDDADGWQEKTGQGVVWTKQALEQLVEVLEKVGTGTTADLGEGGSDGESARKDVLSVTVVGWIEGIAEYVGGQVEEKKDAKGKGKAAEGNSSSHGTQSHPQDGPLPQQQASPDFPFGRLDADEAPRMDGIASTSASGFQNDSSQTLVASNGPSSLDNKPFIPSFFRQDPSRSAATTGADAVNPPCVDPKDPANLLTSSGRRSLVYQRVERCLDPPEWYMLGESGERRVKEEDGEDGIGWVGEKDGVDAEGDARMATQVEGAQGRRRSERAPSPPSERKARKVASQVENEGAEDEGVEDVVQMLEEPSPAQKPRDGVEGGGAQPNGVAGPQSEAGETGAPAKNAHLASPASQHQRSPSDSSAARSPTRSPTPPPAQQQPKQKKVQRQKPLVKKAQAGLFKPPSEVDEDEAEAGAKSKGGKRKGKAVSPASKKREREEQDEEVDELDSDVDGEVEASGGEQDEDSGASTAAKGAKRKKVVPAPAKKRPMPTVKKAGAATRSSPRKAALSSRAAPSTSKTAKKRASLSYTSSEEDEVDQLASDEEPDKRLPPKKRTRASTERPSSTQRARRTSSGASASPASSPKAVKKAAPAKKSTPAPVKSQRPIKEGSRRSARMSSEAPGVKKEEEVVVEAGTIGFAVQRTAGLRCWPILQSDEDSVVFCPLPGTRPIADAEPVICTNSLQLVSSPPIAPIPDGTPILDTAKAKALKLAQELAADKRELKKWVARVEKVWADQEVEESE
ncbi:Proteophosphoglycan ppg4 [Rhodotorula toruloides ATCC 204091]|uniref:Proteophosphoglycan ppg4 n=1 Tax=Rhodotorula toruloides TaxID=5286 RepID=A0A0K3CCU9_RHOTO|nr:Proteophosphoglycan ppg4 [Rhodotorula toruloides ATCC 204091]KAK4330972.1 Proteophosphoglycan ppg4 [Rhodotorula toruloides]PRQ75491.1 Proteophosphoglycan ppg4 [Rhodotorula toruloides]